MFSLIFENQQSRRKCRSMLINQDITKIISFFMMFFQRLSTIAAFAIIVFRVQQERDKEKWKLQKKNQQPRRSRRGMLFS